MHRIRLHRGLLSTLTVGLFLLGFAGSATGQGVTTAAMSGIVTDTQNLGLPGANVVAVHQPSGTMYGVASRIGGVYNIPNMRIGGPYQVIVSFVGYESVTENNIYLTLGQNLRLDFELAEAALEFDMLTVTGEQDEVLNAGRTGAATTIDREEVLQLPSIKRSTRDLTRIDPRNDGNYSFAGRNWLYNNISLDGSYFNNSFGLDDPAVGGQTAAEPVPFDAVEQVQVSIAPYDVRQSGFTGANVNTVTRSGTNTFSGSVYTFWRNESLIGNSVKGEEVIADPDLTFNQTGFSIGGPIIKDKLFFFVNGEIERRDDPGTNFVADEDGNVTFGESRVSATTMDQISQVMRDVYGYETGPYQGFVHETNNDKLLIKLDWNISESHNLSARYNFLDAERDLPPHAFVLSFNNSGRGPNSASLPFRNAGYSINNEFNSFAVELNSRGSGWANRLFTSYNRFRDFREPFSADFPTIEIGEGGITYTTVGHEPFSIHNILDQDVIQVTNNFTYFQGRHVLTLGANFEHYSFFNSFNIFRHGLFQLPDFLDFLCGTTFSSLDDFFARTDPDSENFYDFNSCVGSGPFKGEKIEVAQVGLYAQDELIVSPTLNLTFGVRVDVPMYLTDPVDNPFSRGLTALDPDDNPVTIDQSELPGSSPLFSPRIGFNYDLTGDRSTQLRGGTGIFTGRVPFVWIGNVISNPGNNPNLYPNIQDVPEDHVTDDSEERGRSILQTSFDLNAFAEDFKWPQIWTTNIAVDHKLPWDLLGTVEVLYGKDINAIFMRNDDLIEPVRTLADGRPYFLGPNGNELNPDGGPGIYTIDNTSEGWNFNVTAQLRKLFPNGLNTSLSYAYTEAKNNLQSTEIASVLWQSQPVQGDPNQPGLGWSQFNQRHRIVGTATYRHSWSNRIGTSLGVFFEAAEGGLFTAAGGNRFSFVYAGDVNGDGYSNDMIYVPTGMDDIKLGTIDENGDYVSDPNQWFRFDAFIEQDSYLSGIRGEIAERNGGLNPWYTNIDLRLMQDFKIRSGGQDHTLQVSFDVQNVANLISSDWGVRRGASPAAIAPLGLVGWDNAGDPVFSYTGPGETYADDPGELSRWRAQLGVRYIFN